jgi:hypothetical protein
MSEVSPANLPEMIKFIADLKSTVPVCNNELDIECVKLDEGTRELASARV